MHQGHVRGIRGVLLGDRDELEVHRIGLLSYDRSLYFNHDNSTIPYTWYLKYFIGKSSEQVIWIAQSDM